LTLKERFNRNYTKRAELYWNYSNIPPVTKKFDKYFTVIKTPRGTLKVHFKNRKHGEPFEMWKNDLFTFTLNGDGQTYNFEDMLERVI